MIRLHSVFVDGRWWIVSNRNFVFNIFRAELVEERAMSSVCIFRYDPEGITILSTDLMLISKPDRYEVIMHAVTLFNLTVTDQITEK